MRFLLRTQMRILTVLVVLWLVIGGAAAGQRHYFNSTQVTCAHAGTIALTIVAGPLNYFGVNPKVACHIPQPSA